MLLPFCLVPLLISYHHTGTVKIDCTTFKGCVIVEDPAFPRRSGAYRRGRGGTNLLSCQNFMKIKRIGPVCCHICWCLVLSCTCTFTNSSSYSTHDNTWHIFTCHNHVRKCLISDKKETFKRQIRHLHGVRVFRYNLLWQSYRWRDPYDCSLLLFHQDVGNDHRQLTSQDIYSNRNLEFRSLDNIFHFNKPTVSRECDSYSSLYLTWSFLHFLFWLDWFP